MLFRSIRPEWVDPIIRMAKRRGLRVTGHVPAFMRAEDAVLAGYDELAHINQVLLNFVSRPGDDNRTLDRFTRVGDDAQFFRPQGAEARRFIDLLKARGTVVDPTLVAFESMYTQQQREPNPSFSMIAEHLPAQWQRELRAADRPKFDKTMKEGRNQMPSWDGQFTPQQLEQIWAYIRSRAND